MKITQKKLLEAVTNEEDNLADLFSDDDLTLMGKEVIQNYLVDLESRGDWEKHSKEWLSLAAQIREQKNEPWPGASNVKYPLLTKACLQFHARASQTLIHTLSPVVAKPMGRDVDGRKASRASRNSTYMNYQLVNENKDWITDQDRLLLILSVIGLAYKKTWYSPAKGYNCSELVLPNELIVSYRARKFEEARKTHAMWVPGNTVSENKVRGLYSDVDLGDPSSATPGDQIADSEDKRRGIVNSDGETEGHYFILEQHYYWDFDDDGYKEPYIVTVDYHSEQVLRIVPRYSINDVERIGDKIARIKPEEYFTLYTFIPDFTSATYGIGFGQLLGPINAAANTSINQLIDAGTMSNLQSGFLGQGMRLPNGGMIKFKPGEWKVVPVSGDDIRKNVFPLPVREPSNVLFQLLGLLIQAGEETGSISDVMQGKNPGQNQPFSTTMAVLEQGMQVFTGIYRRVYRAMGEEYRKLYSLNSKHLDISKYLNVLDLPENEMAEVSNDWNTEDMDVFPAADPDIVSQSQKLLKSESLLQKVMAGLPLNLEEVTMRTLEAEGHEDIDKLLQTEQKVDPEVQFEQMKFQDESERAWASLLLEAHKQETETVKDLAQAIAHIARAESMTEASKNQQLAILVDLMQNTASLNMDARSKSLDQAFKVKDSMAKARLEIEKTLLASRTKERIAKKKQSTDGR